MKKKLMIIVLSILLSALAGFVLIVGVYALPKNRMVNNVIRSHALLESEGNYRYWASDITKTQSDNFSDALMADIAVNPGKNNLFYDAMINAYMAWPDTDNASEWLLRETGGEPLYPGHAQVVYGRYWHGYLLWMKPLLLLFTIPEMRLINMGVTFLLFAYVFLLAFTKIGVHGAFAIALAIFSLNPVSTIMTFHFSDIIFNAMISSIVILNYHKMLEEKDRWYLVFLFAGIATAFFDLMTYPLVSLGIPLILWLLLSKRTLRENLICVILFSVVWVVGYAGMWVLKWLIGTLISGYNLILDGIETVGFRSSGEVVNVSSDYFYVVNQNLSAMFTRPLIFALVLFVIGLAVLAVLGRLKFRFSLSRIVPVLLVGIYPFVWYFVIRNHSIVHVWFTHRVLSITIFSLAAFFACMFTDKERE
ncbi:MAG: hypothetical protein IKD66_13645 [Solobacterium sp.]|nr:hypothetical protein [Solobacterium sp.]